MPRYSFDMHDGELHRHDEGSEPADYEAARKEAMIFLPEVARWEIPKDGDHRPFSVFVRDESGTIVYTGRLTYSDIRLTNAEKP